MVNKQKHGFLYKVVALCFLLTVGLKQTSIYVRGAVQKKIILGLNGHYMSKKVCLCIQTLVFFKSKFPKMQ